MMDASAFDAAVAYASVDRHQLQDFDPYIYRTRDSGNTWQRITAGLPAGVYVHTIKSDPIKRGLLFAGTERGAFVSFDDGDHWQSLKLNLPVTSVRDFQIYENDLIVGTHGRGIWVIDSMVALRQIDDSIASSSAYLFRPAESVYVAQGGDNGTPTQKDEATFPNAENGVFLDYFLKTDASGPVTIDILDSSGATIATLSSTPSAVAGAGAGAARGGGAGAGIDGIPNTSPIWRVPQEPMSAKAGMHRVVWVPTSGGGRRGGFGGAPATTFVGTFSARLTANGQTMTQPLVVKPDPRLPT